MVINIQNHLHNNGIAYNFTLFAHVRRVMEAKVKSHFDKQCIAVESKYPTCVCLKDEDIPNHCGLATQISE